MGKIQCDLNERAIYTEYDSRDYITVALTTLTVWKIRIFEGFIVNILLRELVYINGTNYHLIWDLPDGRDMMCKYILLDMDTQNNTFASMDEYLYPNVLRRCNNLSMSHSW